MTRSRNTPASRTDSSLLTTDGLTAADLDETSRQAWTQAMTVRPFGDAYLVDCAERTHYVTLDPSSCSCDDAADDSRRDDHRHDHRTGDTDADKSILDEFVDDRDCEVGNDENRDDEEQDESDDSSSADSDDSDDSDDRRHDYRGGPDANDHRDDREADEYLDGGDDADRDVDDDRCVHVRRVAIEINLGRIPPPSEHSVECAGCDRRVAVSAADAPPYLCPECHLEPGDVVVDTDGDGETPLLVVSEPGRPADLVSVPDENRTVSEYPGNDRYAPDTPVVEAVYAHAVSTDRQPRRYLFPLPRLGRPDSDERGPPELGREPPSTLEP